MKKYNCPICNKELIRLKPFEKSVYEFWCDDCDIDIAITKNDEADSFKWWCEDIDYIHAVLNRDRDKGYSIDECDVLAVLEYPKVDIELTVRGIDEEDNLIYDYYCCVNYAKDSNKDGWESYDWVEFGDVEPKEFTTEKELMEDMNKQLIEFCKEHNLKMF